MTKTSFVSSAASVLALLALLSGASSGQTPAPATQPGKINVELELVGDVLDDAHLRASRMGYMPAALKITPDKPAGVIKEPAYQGKPQYGAFRIGNGPRASTFIVVDEPETGTSKLYVDRNQNGDLTDDGPGEWANVREIDGVKVYMTYVTVNASWGTPLAEELAGTYSLRVYKRHGVMSGGYAKMSGWTGKVTLGEKTYPILLHEQTNDGLFTVPATGDLTRRPVELCIDLDGDGTFKGVIRSENGKEFKYPERLTLADPVQIDGQWYVVRPNISGRKLTFAPVDAPGTSVAIAQAPTEFKRAPEVGSVAPDFTVQAPDGSPIKLSDFRGKVVVIDFWATWCGPCQAAMPGLERINQQVKDQNVVIFSVSVWDAKVPFDAWMKKFAGTKYNFTFAFDPAGRAPENVAASKYGVTGIPTMYVVDREGKIAAGLVGGGNEAKLVQALTKLGITVHAEKDEKVPVSAPGGN